MNNPVRNQSKLRFELLSNWRVRIRVIITLASFLVLAVGTLTYLSTSEYRDAGEIENNTYETISIIKQTQLLILRVHTDHQTFLVNEESIIRRTYKQEAHEHLRMLRSMTKNSVGQQEHLDHVAKLVDVMFMRLRHTVAESKSGNLTQEEKKLYAHEQEKVAYKIIDELEAMKDLERTYLFKHKETSLHRFNEMWIIITIGYFLAFLLALGAISLLKSEVFKRSKAEKELLVAKDKAEEGSQLKSHFVANMSHEIRTPLNGIIGIAKLLGKTNLDQKQIELVDILKGSSHALKSIINDILDLSKIESGKLILEESHFELRSLIGNTLNILSFPAREKGLTLRSEIDDQIPLYLLGDPTRLRQVLINLIGNAIKFSSDDEILIRVRIIRLGQSRAEIIFEVIDHGIGFDDVVKSQIFQPFVQADSSTTRKFGGTGLGLSICRKIIQMMGGDIDVESQPGQGSRFFFIITLPISAYQPALSSEEGLDIVDSEHIGAKILVAEDNIANQVVIKGILNEMRHEAFVVSNGKEAIEALQGQNFDAILMDGHMPEMDGYEASEAIRSGAAGIKNCTIPIIAVTAAAIKEDKERSILVGMDEYIAKPISFDDFKFKLTKILSLKDSPIDQSVIDKMKKLETNTQSKLVDSLINIFLESFHETVEKMNLAIAENNYTEISEIAHSFKSTCANVGAYKMKRLGDIIEKAAINKDNHFISGLVEELKTEFVKAEQELKKYA